MKDFPGFNQHLSRLKERYPGQKWIVFTDYDDEKLRIMQNALHLNHAKIIDTREIY